MEAAFSQTVSSGIEMFLESLPVRDLEHFSMAMATTSVLLMSRASYLCSN